MAIMGCNLKEVIEFENEIEKVKCQIKYDTSYQTDIINHGKNYDNLKKYFQKFVRFFRYSTEVKVDFVYRVRKCDINEPFTSRKDLIYPEPSKTQKDRMNNARFRVLYVSLNEYTAIAESRMNHDYINKYFQLTRFAVNKPLKVFKLGRFSELYLNTPRDSTMYKNELEQMFGSEYQDTTVQGYSALECAILDILYSTDKNSYILSSILADVIFTENKNIDAILYPTMQNRYGINLAIKKEFVDEYLTISYSNLNKLIDVYSHGFYKYNTIEECIKIEDENNLKFLKVNEQATYR